MSLWADSRNPGAAFGSLRKGAAHLDAVERLKEWTRGRFTLAADEVILVSEIAPSLPGCPPLETLVAFWTADGTRHHFKVFKRMEEVAEDDLPPAWLKGALAASEGIACACC
jgi:nitrate reductase delta subunit